MKEIVNQWYIKQDLRYNHLPMTNYFPHNISKKEFLQLYTFVEDFKLSEEDNQTYNIVYEGPILEELVKKWNDNNHDFLDRCVETREEFVHGWHMYKKETTISFIKENEIVDVDFRRIDIFPIRFYGVFDEIFRIEKLSPFTFFPDYVINWLRVNQHVIIAFHDIYEGRLVAREQIFTMPGIALMMKNYNLTNRVVYIDNKSETKHYRSTFWQFPKGYGEHNGIKVEYHKFSHCGSKHWLQFNYNNAWKQFQDRLNSYSINISEPNFRSGRILAFGGRMRVSRTHLIMKLFNQISPNMFFCNFWGNSNKLENKKILTELIDEFNHSNNHEYGLILFEQMLEFINKLPLTTFPKSFAQDYVKSGGAKYMKNAYHHYPDPDIYKHIFVDFSPETVSERGLVADQDKDLLLFSEKICKPIFACRPFVTSANPGYYKKLQELGFKTFNQWWPEDFDDDIDIISHVNKIVDIAKLICSWDVKKCELVYNEMKPILEHNRQHLLYYANEAPRSWIQELCKIKWNRLLAK